MREERTSNITLQIVIQRRLLSRILNTFLPTILINIIGHMSNYFSKDFFEGVMAMNVTVMLVLTTLFVRDIYQQANNNLEILSFLFFISFLIFPS